MGTTQTRAELERLKAYAKLLFVKEALSAEGISMKTGIDAATVNKWITAGGWKKLQRNFILTSNEQIDDMLDELAELRASIKNKPEGERYPDIKEVEIKAKLSRAIKDLGTTSVPEVISICDGLLGFIQKVDLRKAQELSYWMDSYIKSLL